MAAPKTYGIYHAMQEKGVFLANPANVDSRDAEGIPQYRGPVAYPKMLYEPTGKERILVAGYRESTPTGIVEVPPQKELISKIVQTPEEERALRAEGWTDHPSLSIERDNAKRLTAGEDLRPVPALGLDAQAKKLEATLADKDAEIEKLKRDLAAASKTKG